LTSLKVTPARIGYRGKRSMKVAIRSTEPDAQLAHLVTKSSPFLLSDYLEVSDQVAESKQRQSYSVLTMQLCRLVFTYA
jgi:hypothetical protein